MRILIALLSIAAPVSLASAQGSGISALVPSTLTSQPRLSGDCGFLEAAGDLRPTCSLQLYGVENLPTEVAVRKCEALLQARFAYDSADVNGRVSELTPEQNGNINARCQRLVQVAQGSRYIPTRSSIPSGWDRTGQ